MRSSEESDSKNAHKVVEAFLRVNGRKNPAKPLPDVYREFIAEASAQFPELKGKLVIWDCSEEVAYGEKLSPSTKQFLKSAPWGFSSGAEYVAERDLYVISIGEDRALDKRGRTVLPLDADKHMIRILDHELAHLLIRKLNPFIRGERSGEDPPLQELLLSEAASDAYMLMREYQRYGVHAVFDDPQLSSAARADWMIRNGDIEHFTSFVTDAIANRKDKIDFSRLTPAETLQAAEDFAVVYSVTAEQATKLHAEFNKLLPVRKRRLDWNDTLTRMESTTYKHSPEERRERLEKALRKGKLDDAGAKLARVLLGGMAPTPPQR